jgi:uncharacterized integral membrane protein (TIGR00697 family)
MSSTLLIALYVACELIANITANKTVSLFGVTAPAGVFIYALTFTLIDLVNEHLGKLGARRVIYAAFAANILFAMYSAFVVLLPYPSFFTGQEAFAQVLGSTPRIVSASLLAYIVSSLIDVEVFDAWKRRVGGHKWARVVASNAVSTAVDSALFVSVAFSGLFPLIPLIAGQYLFKMAITVVSVPLIYATRWMKVDAAGE